VPPARRLRLLAAVFVLAVSVGSASPAAADPLLDQKRSQYAQVEQQVQELDARAEALTEQYDRAAWRLAQLHRRIVATSRRLAEEQALLVREQALLRRRQQSLAALLVAAYKGGDLHALDIVFGSRSLSELTGGIDLQRRLQQAVKDAVDAVDAAVVRVRAARDAIARERQTLVESRAEVARQARLLARRRVQIRAELVRRRVLLDLVGHQLRVAEAASSVDQSQVALAAQAWLLADQRANRPDPGAVLRDQIALDALEQLGVPYVWGGASPSGFDCSGLVMWLWAQHGYQLPHFAAAQYHLGSQVAAWDLRPGDLVFFHDLGHVGIYLGHGYLVHAPHTGSSVRIEQLSAPWFQRTYVGATRPGPA
jgi:cell wall-associated NlpC family hydrolase